jgi:hypothetical protein
VPEVLFDLANDPGETVNIAEAPEHAKDMSKFRKRLAQLGHGPGADSQYTNAGYQTGHSEAECPVPVTG